MVFDFLSFIYPFSVKNVSRKKYIPVPYFRKGQSRNKKEQYPFRVLFGVIEMIASARAVIVIGQGIG